MIKVLSHNVNGILGSAVVSSSFSYDPLSPYEVSLDMTIQNSDSKSVNWVFSRELLINVLTSTNGTACGDGDVKVSLANKFLSISVGTNATNRVTISYPAVLVQKFIDRTTDLICPGNETFFITIPDTIDLMFPDAQSL